METPRKRDPLKAKVKSDAYIAHQFAQLLKPSPLRPIAFAVRVHLLTLLLILIAALLLTWWWPAGIVFAALSSVAVGREYRGLECLIHGASHYDVCGIQRKSLNDSIADSLMATAVCQSVGPFREAHLVHHNRFNSEADPCRKRMHANDAVRDGGLPTMWSTLKRLPSETIGFYSQVGSNPVTLAEAFGWHLTFLVAPVAAIMGWGVALAAWAIIMVLVFVFMLPLIRALAEAAEHDYANDNFAPGDQLRRTFNHDGLLNDFLHPFGDKFHVEHHAFPGVPQYNLKKLHALLRDRVPEFVKIVRHRNSVLSTPETYEASFTGRAANDNETADQQQR